MLRGVKIIEVQNYDQFTIGKVVAKVATAQEKGAVIKLTLGELVSNPRDAYEMFMRCHTELNEQVKKENSNSNYIKQAKAAEFCANYIKKHFMVEVE